MADAMTCPRCGLTREDGFEITGLCPGCLISLGLPEASHAESNATPANLADTSRRRKRFREGSPGSSDRPEAPLSSPRPSDGAFLPGTVLARRYRIVGLVGEGGMAEVYRADDLRLGQPVALKFLPHELSRDEEWLGRFAREVRVARQVTHPNICRIYDLQEAEGLAFITMEYIDGEDLASLLRRIGHLPREKAIQIAFELCAGLASLHDRGILHRDLKPGNVMIDGRGRARITDFGLAVLAGELPRGEARAGTPGYMAPEQRAGLGASVRSDIYSLGLVMYELFTGQRAFSPESSPRVRPAPRRPSDVVDGIDPLLDQIILRCLDPQPSERPGSVREISSSLPSWAPAALAPGGAETPSPEMVAEGGGTRRLATPAAVGCAAMALLLLTPLVFLSGRTQLSRVVPLEDPPEVLVKSARDLLADLSIPRLPHATSGFTYERELLPVVLQKTKGLSGWRLVRGAPSPILFWYSQGDHRPTSIDRSILWPVPPASAAVVPGMARLWLDPQGRLRRLVAFPPEAAESEVRGDPWLVLLAAAGLEPALLEAAEPAGAPPVPTQLRAAWRGTYPLGTFAVRVEAGLYGGTPVYFDMTLPSHSDVAPPPSASDALEPVTGMMVIAWFVTALLGGLVLAVRNLRAGRGDRRGALRVAISLLVLRVGSWVLGGNHIADISEFFLFTANLAWGFCYFCLGWIWYVALEPYARRLWPGKMASWVRLLNGRLRDPLVGRDWLFGTLGGLGIALVVRLGQIAPASLGATASRLDHLGPFVMGLPELRALDGAASSLAVLLACLEWALFYGLLSLIPLIVLRVLMRSQWTSVLALGILGALALIPAAGTTPVAVLTAALVMAVWGILVLLAGLLPLMVALSVYAVLVSFPLTADLTTWHAQTSLLAFTFVIASASYASFTATARRQTLEDNVPSQQAKFS